MTCVRWHERKNRTQFYINHATSLKEVHDGGTASFDFQRPVMGSLYTCVYIWFDCENVLLSMAV